jgi:MraZ protein
MENWQSESAMVSKLNMFKKKNAEFVTKFMAGVKPVELDTTGRLLIPKDLQKYGGISKEIVLTSVANRIEIWDKAAYEQAVDYDPDDFAGLAEEVMGDLETE